MFTILNEREWCFGGVRKKIDRDMWKNMIIFLEKEWPKMVNDDCNYTSVCKGETENNRDWWNGRHMPNKKGNIYLSPAVDCYKGDRISNPSREARNQDFLSKIIWF